MRIGVGVINSYDIDGVINMGKYIGLRPRPEDVIITGRSYFDEADYTIKWLRDNGIQNSRVYMNPVKFETKTREGSGKYKASKLNYLLDHGVDIGIHYEDDPVQANIIEQECPRVKVVRIVHDLVEKENVWHGSIDDGTSSKPIG
jgi:hypothetical protein